MEVTNQCQGQTLTILVRSEIQAANRPFYARSFHEALPAKSVTPRSRANAYQCRGCGRWPSRIRPAYHGRHSNCRPNSSRCNVGEQRLDLSRKYFACELSWLCGCNLCRGYFRMASPRAFALGATRFQSNNRRRRKIDWCGSFGVVIGDDGDARARRVTPHETRVERPEHRSVQRTRACVARVGTGPHARPFLVLLPALRALVSFFPQSMILPTLQMTFSVP
jgi:hypothetical protein